MSLSLGLYCPICGRSTMKSEHECPPSVLRAIDAENTRAANREFEGTMREPLHRTEGRRLAEGFYLLGLDND